MGREPCEGGNVRAPFLRASGLVEANLDRQ
jgi:hypothetical protein